MSIFDREKLAKTAQSIADHALLIDHVKALQEGQKEIASSLIAINNRLSVMEAEFKILKAETQRDALREVQSAVNSVQGAFHDKLGTLATKVAILEHDINTSGKNGGIISLPSGRDRIGDDA